jgi:hypothetical protein
MAAMKPVFPMIGLEYRYSVPPTRQGHFTDFLYSTSRQAEQHGK